MYKAFVSRDSWVVAPIGLRNGIFAIYDKMCNGPCTSADDVAFPNFAPSAGQLFGATDPRTALVTALGNAHGVSEALTP